MTIQGTLHWTSELSIPQLACTIFALYLTYYIIYLAFLDPLRSIPGPFLRRITPLWSWYHSLHGDETQQISLSHTKYGPIVRISPNQVVIADGTALATIYAEKGGFLKALFYENFDAEGHQTIFSARDVGRRSERSKAVGQMFSVGALKGRGEVIRKCVDGFVERLRVEAEASRNGGEGKPVNVDVLKLARGLAINVVGVYLFGKEYGDLNDEATMHSAGAYVDFIVDIGRFFFLPPWLFHYAFSLTSYWQPLDPVAEKSMSQVDTFTRSLAEKPLSANDNDDSDTYQGRLLKAGVSVEETDVQMKDVVFAGTDTTALNLSYIIWNLVKHPDVYAKLQHELAQTNREDDTTYDAQRHPYLDGVIREGLRTLRANATHFPRQVPPSGYIYTSPSGQTFHLPAGTIVGIAPSTLHFNPAVFPGPHEFKPERWLDPTPAMLRDWIPFSLGSRQCIARNLAMMELSMAVRAVVRSDVLRGAETVMEKIEVVEWFNARIVGGKVQIRWR
jgi:cytochrome P450